MQNAARARAVEKITRLSAASYDLVTFWPQATEVIATAVPYYWTPCWFTLDPASLLITSHYHDGLAEFPDEWLAEEYYGDDVHRLVDVVQSEAGLSTLHEVTNGDPTGTMRWQQNMEMGGDQELIARLRARSGETWGALGLYREPDRPTFEEEEKQFLKDVSPYLAEGAAGHC